LFTLWGEQAHSGKDGGIVGQGCALAVEKSAGCQLEAVKENRMESQIVFCGHIFKIMDMGRTFDHGNSGIVQALQSLAGILAADQKGLAGDEKRTGKQHPQLRFSADRLGGVAGKQIDLFAEQGGKPGPGGQRHKGDLVRSLQNRRRYGPAKVDIHARPLALRILQSKTWNVRADPAADRLACQDTVQGLACPTGHRQKQADECENERAHDQSFLSGKWVVSAYWPIDRRAQKPSGSPGERPLPAAPLSWPGPCSP